MSTLSDRVHATARRLEAMREVTVIMWHGVDGHPQIICENNVVFSPKTDEIDTECLPTIRKAWLESISRQSAGEALFFSDRDSPERMKEKIAAALEDLDEQKLTMDEAFINAARYPVPSEYAVNLPIGSAGLRRKILESLVPFHQTRAMLLKLEDELELPMRCLHVMHVPVNPVTQLRASVGTTGSPLLN